MRDALHMSFTSPPGTGKTMVAMRMATILYRLNYVRNKRHSHPLALTQLLLVYHLLRARQLDQILV
jgi:MoxR-like ATPase